MATTTWQAKKDKVKVLLDSIHDQLEQHLHTKEDILELLHFNQKFHRYSFRNMLLIDSQFKGAMAVGSYQFWKEQGFQVQRGEKGIEILTPVKVTLFKDEQGQEKSLKSATKEEKDRIQKGEIQTRQLTTFKMGYVFDVSQTNAKASDLPKIFPNRWLDGTVPHYDSFYQGLEKVADSIGVKVVEPKQELGVAKGVSYTGLNEVALNPRNGELQNVKTLLHELAHAKLHTSKTRLNYTQAEREFQAELVAYAVCSHFNLDVSDYSLDYLKHWTKGTKIKDKIHLIEEVYQTSQDYIGVLEEHFELEKSRESSKLHECGKILKACCQEVLTQESGMYFIEREELMERLNSGEWTNEDWQIFVQDVERLHLGVGHKNVIEMREDLDEILKDDTLDCVVICYQSLVEEVDREAQLINELFPDENFRKAILEDVFEQPKDHANRDLYDYQLEAIQSQVVLSVSNSKVSDLTGIDQFKSLKHLDVAYNPIQHLNMEKMSELRSVKAYCCALTEVIPPHPEQTQLRYLDVTHNQLKTVDLKAQDCLQTLCLSENQLTEVKLEDCEKLQYLTCSHNRLNELNIDDCYELRSLECENNYLSVLDTSNNEELQLLACQNNLLTSLELNHCQQLERLECANNQLESLGIQLLEHLSYVDCRGNEKSSAELIQGASKQEKVEELEYGE